MIEKIRIGHDNKGITPGWHLDKVEVRRLQEDGETSTTYTFPCKRWLAKDEDDGSVVRELIPQRVVEESVTEDGEFKTREVNQETLEREFCEVWTVVTLGLIKSTGAKDLTNIDAYYSWLRKRSMNFKLFIQYSRCTIWPIGTILRANCCSVIWASSFDCILEKEWMDYAP